VAFSRGLWATARARWERRFWFAIWQSPSKDTLPPCIAERNVCGREAEAEAEAGALGARPPDCVRPLS
jgi:hypothetical protein